MKRKLMLLLTCLFLGISLVTAQNQKVTGVVLSAEDGQPVIGASVAVKGTTIGTVTDADGNFKLSIPNSAKMLKVSYIGMIAQDVEIRQNMKIILKPNAQVTEEVVVVGYGTAKKVGSVVGSFTKVGSDKLELKPAVNAMDALQGQVPGLQIYTSSGEPGTSSSSYIRGVGSLTADNSPLYILDGAPVGSDVFVSINPNDIESVTVLKDASATSIYGSRAANGVIYVTTKRGKIGEKAVVTASASYGVSSLARKLGDPMNAKELADFQLGLGIISQTKHDQLLSTGADTKWQDYFFKDNAPTYQGNISVRGGGGRSTYFISGGYVNQEGTSIRSKYEKYNFRSNVESQANDWLRVGVNLAGLYDKSENSAYTYQSSNYTAGGIFGSMLRQPYYNPYGTDGKPLDYIPGVNAYSPYFLLDKQPNNTNNAQVNSTAFIQLTPIKGLVIRSQGGLEAYDYRNTNKTLPSLPSAKGVGRTQEKFARNVKLTITNTAEYKFNMSDVHNFTVLLGQEGVKNNYESFASETSGQSDDRLTMLQAGTTAKLLAKSYNDQYDYVFSSFFGRVDYSFSDKYYADFSVRTDGSSRFGKDHKYATFYSGGLMWDLKKEAFLSDVDLISGLKLKGSVGSTGNSSIGNYNHLALVGTTLYNTQGGWTLSSSGNPDLRWEKQITGDLGIELSLLNKYKFELTYYKRKTKDMLMDVPLPYTSGFSTLTQNVGAMSNNGVELSVNLDLVKTKDWYVGFSANYNYNKNKIDQLFYGYTEWPMLDNLTMYKVGQSLQFYVPKYAGVDPADGAPMWYVPGKDGETTKTYDQGTLSQATGKTQAPPHSGGFSFNLTWKGLSLNTDFAWMIGKYMINNDRYFSENPTAFGTMNQSRDLLGNMWEKEGDIAKYPAYGYYMEFDDHLLENASFLRMKNLTVSYNLPKSLLNYTKVVNGIKVFATARNLFTLTSYKGADPEIDSNLTYGAYPNSRQFTFGAEIVF